MFGQIFNKTKNYENLGPADIAERMKQNKDAVLLDVRTPGEYGNGHIPGAKNIDITAGSFHQEIESLDKNKEYIVYCASGGRSVAACRALTNQGFEKLVNLSTGISGWTGPIDY